VADARRRLHDVLARCAFSGIPELLRLARTLDYELALNVLAGSDTLPRAITAPPPRDG
jgi:hypothetical protein